MNAAATRITDNFQRTISLSPFFFPVAVGPDRYILVGETESFVLTGKAYSGLFSALKGTSTVQDIVVQGSSIHSQHELLFLIGTLIEKKILVLDGSAGGTIGENRIAPNPDIITSRRFGAIEIVSLTAAVESGFLETLASELRHRAFETVVIADDYSDARLVGLHDRYCTEKRSWLLLKLSGKRLFVGPCFRPGAASACLHCLTFHLCANQPVRKWLLAKGYLHPERIPVVYQPKTVETIFPVILDCIERLAEGSGELLYTIDIEAISAVSHAVRRRPQCPFCGDPDSVRRVALRPIEPARCLKIGTSDGGSRSVTAGETVRRLMGLVSPVSGVVADIRHIGKSSESGVSIYESSFHKTPLWKDVVENSDFIQISLGKGLSDAQSKASALCECIERHSCRYRGDEYAVTGRVGELDGKAVAPDELVFFSSSQYKNFRRRDTLLHEAFEPPPAPFSDLPIHWALCWSLALKEKRFVPFTYCYADSPYENEYSPRFNSNGCACGNTVEEAIIQGLYESIERDAVAIWWYNRIPRPAIAVEGLPVEHRRRIEAFLSDEWSYWVLDVTHDFAIPVMAAIGRNARTGEFRFGFGCHLNPRIACFRALTELCQLLAIGTSHSKMFDFRSVGAWSFLLPDPGKNKKTLDDYRCDENEDIAEDIRFCVQRMRRLDFDVLVHNYVRPDIPMSTVKVIVPGLCHIWPQLGNERLYSTPVRMGWRDTELTEDDLNPVPLLV